MSVTVEHATVYRTSAGRRYLTKKSAFVNEAMRRLKAKYGPDECYYDRDRGPAYDRDYHSEKQIEEFQAIAARYYRRFGKGRKAE